MSKYIAIIDLPDDSRCRGCPLFNEEQSTCPEMEELIDMNVWENPMNWNRNKNSDCPLIPVERLRSAMVKMQINATSDHDNLVIWECMETVANVLGLKDFQCLRPMPDMSNVKPLIPMKRRDEGVTE